MSIISPQKKTIYSMYACKYIFKLPNMATNNSDRLKFLQQREMSEFLSERDYINFETNYSFVTTSKTRE